MPPHRPPALMEELIEEVLLRLPPDDPACLARAALVCMPWCRLIAGRGFRRRFRKFHHRAAPMLGFVCNVVAVSDDEDRTCNARFVPTSPCLPRPDLRGWQALDSRHGRVLVYTYHWLNTYLAVCNWGSWKCIYLQPLDRRRFARLSSFNATVLCAGVGVGAGAGGAYCDHLDCHRGPFVVVLVGTYAYGVGLERQLFTSVYSSDAGAWRDEPTIVTHPQPGDGDDDSILFVPSVPAALVGHSLYFLITCTTTNRILKYDLGTRWTSTIRMPPGSYGRIILMTTEQGKLGFTRADDDFKLYLWSMEVGTQGDAVWTRDRVIELQNLLPADALLISPDVVGCVHGRGLVFVSTGDGFFTVDPKLNLAIKVGEGIPCMMHDDGHWCFFTVVPYTSFYFPVLGAVPTAEEPSAGASSA